ncbi:hypothetical protein [Streptosporangium sp. NPDC001681]|uniref:hypothetical protein n=1 Tax=Streptosporangium sp. NPDC001681 TaxID=3154395 RepID=UPI00331E1862
MSNPSAPVLDRQAVGDCGCFAEVPPMPMGCATCGHAPYAHGCPDRPADHEYVQPSGDLLDIRLRVRRTGDRSLPCFEPAPEAPARMIPAQRSAEVVAPVSAQQRAGSIPAEGIPPIPEQRRPERSPAVESVPASSPRRVPWRLHPASAPTRASRLGCGRRLVPRSGRRTTCAPNRSAVTPSSCRPPGRYGEPLQILPRFMKQARPTLTTTGRALDRIEVQPVRDGSSTHPEPTSPAATIPGWRLILSDAGRLWASRERPFSQVATHAGAERTVDGDSLEALRAETDRQETFAREAEEQAARDQETRETPASEEREQETRERETPEREQAVRERETRKAPASGARETREREQSGQAGQVVS